MEISKNYQGSEQVTVSAQSGKTQQAGEKNQVADVVQKDFQVNLQDGLKTKLAEFTSMLQNRKDLIQSLPEDIRKAVVELLRQMSADTELPQGLENLLKGQKNTAEQLKDLSNILDFSAVLHQDEYSDIKTALQKIFEKFTQQAEQAPEQSAKELVQLAKQLPISNGMPQGNVSQVLEELLEQTVPENMQQLDLNEQKGFVKLTTMLGQDLPAQLQQLTKKNNLSGLPAVWALLKMADAWQFKDIQPKTLQAAADFLRQIAQEITPEKEVVVSQLEKNVQSLPPEMKDKGTVVIQLEKFVQSLPGEMKSKEMVVSQLEKFVQSLPAEMKDKGTVVSQLKKFVQSLPPEVKNKGAIVSQLEKFVQVLPPEVENKGVVVMSPLEEFVQSLPPEVQSKGTVVVGQLEQFVESLPLEVGKNGTSIAQLEKFIKTLPPEIGNILQQTLKQGNDIPNNLRGLADAFSNAIVLHENMSSDLQSVIVKNIENIETMALESPLMSTETNDVLTQVAKQFADTHTTTVQLKNLIQQLKTQMFTGGPVLSDKEQHVVDQIAKLFETNIPQVLQEGGVKHKLPELPKMWALLKVLGVEQWQNIESQNLQKSASAVKELAQSIYKSTNLTGEKQAEHSIVSFSIPLQVAEGIYYPAHIHIYHEEKNNNSQLTQREFETWLRVCIDTDNIGMVDSVFRLYGDNKLDIRVNFPVISAAQQFANDLPEVRKSLENTKLTLTDVIVNKG